MTSLLAPTVPCGLCAVRVSRDCPRCGGFGSHPRDESPSPPRAPDVTSRWTPALCFALAALAALVMWAADATGHLGAAVAGSWP